jgi:hypothetical protein
MYEHLAKLFYIWYFGLFIRSVRSCSVIPIIHGLDEIEKNLEELTCLEFKLI